MNTTKRVPINVLGLAPLVDATTVVSAEHRGLVPLVSVTANRGVPPDQDTLADTTVVWPESIA